MADLLLNDNYEPQPHDTSRIPKKQQQPCCCSSCRNSHVEGCGHGQAGPVVLELGGPCPKVVGIQLQLVQRSLERRVGHGRGEGREGQRAWVCMSQATASAHPAQPGVAGWGECMGECRRARRWVTHAHTCSSRHWCRASSSSPSELPARASACGGAATRVPSQCAVHHVLSSPHRL